MKTKHNLTQISVVLFLLLGLLLGACRANISRNDDGSLSVEASMTEAAIQGEIELALSGSQIQNVEADLHDGYISITGERKRTNSSIIDSMSFRLDLGASDGHLTCVISQAEIDGVSVSAATVAAWNESIASNLTAAGQRNPNSRLESVQVTSGMVTMVWRVETERSK